MIDIPLIVLKSLLWMAGGTLLFVFPINLMFWGMTRPPREAPSHMAAFWSLMGAAILAGMIAWARVDG